jgi:hypothetical protein
MEHVFNFPVAVKNCMNMVKIKGHIMFVSPANNYFGHGFYQFSPELFFSLLSEINGYSNTSIFMQDDRLKWYRVSSPKKVRNRVDISCAKRTPALITVFSQKIGEVPERLSVLQSDYVNIWNNQERSDVVLKSASFALGLYRKIPKNMRNHLTPLLLRCLRNYFDMKKYKEFYERCDEFSQISTKNIKNV